MDIHELRRQLGKPGYHRCAQCFGHAKTWVYDGNDPAELTVDIPIGPVGGRTRTVRYSTDVNRYRALCRPCALRVPADRKVAESR